MGLVDRRLAFFSSLSFFPYCFLASSVLFCGCFYGSTEQNGHTIEVAWHIPYREAKVACCFGSAFRELHGI